MNSKKNIKIITFGNFPYGGASANLLRYFSLGLADKNNDVEVILPTGDYFGNNIDVSGKRTGFVQSVKFRHIAFKIHPRNYLGKFIDLIWGYSGTIIYLLAIGLVKKIDVIVVYNTTLSKTFVFLIFKKLIRSKLITILPEFYEKPKKKLSFSSVKWMNFFLGMRFAVGYSDGFIVASQYLKNYLQKKLKIKKNVLVLPNAMDPEIFKVESLNEFKKGVITIGYCGTPTRKDGVTDLLKSFSLLSKKYSNIQLLIIGDITNGNTIIPELQKMTQELGVYSSVTFTGLVTFQEIPRLLNSCQILALTRPNGVFAEAGFPTKLGEYFACKKPVVISKVGDIPQYFKNEKEVILVEPENIQNISKGFEKLILSEDLRNKIGLSGFQWMNNNLNYRKVSMVIDEYIESLFLE